MVNSVPITSTKMKGRSLRERLLASFGWEVPQYRSMQKVRDFLNRRPVCRKFCDEVLLVADASHDGTLADYIEAKRLVTFNFAGFPCHAREIERIARCALEYVQGESRPDLNGDSCGSMTEPELSGMKGS